MGVRGSAGSEEGGAGGPAQQQGGGVASRAKRQQARPEQRGPGAGPGRRDVLSPERILSYQNAKTILGNDALIPRP